VIPTRYDHRCEVLHITEFPRGRRGHDRMVVGFTTTYYSYFSELLYFDQGLNSRTKIQLFNFYHGGMLLLTNYL
jgi:hypothetical protein